MLIHIERANHTNAIATQSDSATDPPSLRYGATSAVALQLKNAQNLAVSEFQFGGLPAVASAKAGEFLHV